MITVKMAMIMWLSLLGCEYFIYKMTRNGAPTPRPINTFCGAWFILSFISAMISTALAIFMY